MDYNADCRYQICYHEGNCLLNIKVVVVKSDLLGPKLGASKLLAGPRYSHSSMSNLTTSTNELKCLHQYL